MLDTTNTKSTALIRSMLVAGRDLEEIASTFDGGSVVESLFAQGELAIRVGSTTYELPSTKLD
jgi:hypothetical protein